MSFLGEFSLFRPDSRFSPLELTLVFVLSRREESEAAENKLEGGPKVGEDEDMNEADAGDQTLVEIVEEEIEKKAPIIAQLLPMHEARKEHDKVAAEAIICER